VIRRCVSRNGRINENKELVVNCKIFPIVSKSCGFLDRVNAKDKLLSRRRLITFSGWCGDVSACVVAKSVIIFFDDVFVAKGSININREDVSSRFCPEFQKSGFGFSIIVNKEKIINKSFLRAFAILQDKTACELKYAKGLPFRP